VSITGVKNIYPEQRPGGSQAVKHVHGFPGCGEPGPGASLYPGNHRHANNV
jgi:hypothetical protein